jgi:nucleotidyltransferase/DNA polymerase involved in DNA repair
MFGAIYLPDFALQAALRHEPDLRREPAAVLNGEEARATILQVTPAAAEMGVTVGMSPTQGLARCLRLTIKARAYEQEKIAGEILLHHAATLSPEIEATAPGVCTVRFTSRRNCRENLEHVVRQLAALQLTAQAGLAATPDLSFLAACLARPVLEIDQPEKFLAPLPIETLAWLAFA